MGSIFLVRLNLVTWKMLVFQFLEDIVDLI